jgi:hypothetical protein
MFEGRSGNDVCHLKNIPPAIAIIVPETWDNYVCTKVAVESSRVVPLNMKYAWKDIGGGLEAHWNRWKERRS